MDDVEPLRIPPQVLCMGKRRAFLLRSRRRNEGGIARWYGELVVMQSEVAHNGETALSLTPPRWVAAIVILGSWPFLAGQGEKILSGR
ncbi:hypothetical protein ABT294_17270 [Nonomuraea sp. NPDC000554]|uniref:hypothetical protein n=1 Tax=Nonomuraea sp. NPDC000554 TaxID=3154259 RepID=UPI00332316EA